jgi:aminocarboxymuconate-semialdehyde decarboxylase
MDEKTSMTSVRRSVIDVHAHISPAPYVDVLRTLPEDPAIAEALSRIDGGFATKWPLLFGGTDERLGLMEEAGVRLAVLSMATPYIFPSDPSSRIELVRAWNDSCDEIASAHPDSFAVFFSVPLPQIEAAIAETERVAGRTTTAGVTINTHTLQIPLDDSRWFPLYERWNALGLTVFLHPDGFCVKGLLTDYAMDWDVGTQLDDTIAAVRLINSGVLTRFPQLRWIVPHLGGALPFILGRLDQHWERDREERSLDVPPSQAMEGLMFDTAGHNAASIRFASEVLGTRRVMFGSDFPIVGSGDLGAAVCTVVAAYGEGEALDAVLYGNAVAVLSRLRTSASPSGLTRFPL